MKEYRSSSVQKSSISFLPARNFQIVSGHLEHALQTAKSSDLAMDRMDMDCSARVEVAEFYTTPGQQRPGSQSGPYDSGVGGCTARLYRSRFLQLISNI